MSVLMTCCDTRYATVAATLNHTCPAPVTAEMITAFKTMDKLTEQTQIAKDRVTNIICKVQQGSLMEARAVLAKWQTEMMGMFAMLESKGWTAAYGEHRKAK